MLGGAKRGWFSNDPHAKHLTARKAMGILPSGGSCGVDQMLGPAARPRWRYIPELFSSSAGKSAGSSGLMLATLEGPCVGKNCSGSSIYAWPLANAVILTLFCPSPSSSTLWSDSIRLLYLSTPVRCVHRTVDEVGTHEGVGHYRLEGIRRGNIPPCLPTYVHTYLSLEK